IWEAQKHTDPDPQHCGGRLSQMSLKKFKQDFPKFNFFLPFYVKLAFVFVSAGLPLLGDHVLCSLWG
ncbi:MAG: hypothetical protein ACK559_05280, partial [bacterium]